MTPAQTATPSDTRERGTAPAPAQPEQLSSPVTGTSERRTYRGRELAELLPQIRAELGPDAVVTCQREGLVGGIRGFFAQRFVEVEAMAAPPAQGVDIYDGEDAEPDTVEYQVVAAAAEAPEQPLAVGEGFSETLDGVVAVESTGVFADQLAAASAAPSAALESSADAAPNRDSSDELFSFESRPAELSRGRSEYAPEPRARPAAPASVAAPEDRRERASAVPQPPAVPLRWPSADAASEPVLLHSTPAEQAPIESAWFGGESREAGEFLIARGVGARLAEDLIGEARTHDLPFAGAGGMRDALCACVARRLPRHRSLPRDGALIAVVGVGGSGKTRCAAAIAASYKGASALEVRAVVLGRYDSGSELSSLVEPLGVPVHTAERGSRAAVEIAAARSGVLVVADTPTVSPADPAGIGILAVELSALTPEEVLVTLPATSNAAAARQLLAALAPLSPSGIIVTHADETDQLGTAVELSLESGLPVVYIHDGLELPGALAPADPAAIAERLLA
jgi:Meckel syndrome type 1 protein